MRRFLALVLAVLAAGPVAAQRRPVPRPVPRRDATPEASLRRADLEAHLRFLASDELRGRAPGTPGIDAAARYIAEQFRRFGATPVPGHADYYQRFALTRLTPVREQSVIALDDEVFAGVVLAGGRTFATHEGVYVEYGASPSDYAGRDVRGKIVVTRVGAEGQNAPRALVELAARKRRIADSLGAVALLEVYDAPAPWAATAGRFSRPRMELNYAPSIPHLWMQDRDGRFLPQLAATGTHPRVRLETEGLAVTTLPVQNVIGYIQGSDPRLRAEVVALSAHHDHLGAGMRGDATPADSIFNGARDNGTGTVALLAAAEALAKQPPKRSVLLLSYTAEEMGLIGARYFADHPTVPLASVVFNLNVDTGGISDTSVVSLVGATRTTATPLVGQAMQAFGLTLFQSPQIDPLFNASDNVALAQKGVPAPTFSPGFRSLQDSLVARYYHRAADHADASYPFGYLLRFSQAYARAARMIADAPLRPRWTTGDAYQPAAQSLYGPAY